jgi:hypothetical protein
MSKDDFKKKKILFCVALNSDYHANSVAEVASCCDPRPLDGLKWHEADRRPTPVRA